MATVHSMGTGTQWAVYVTANKGYVKVPDVKRWVGEWIDHFGNPPAVARIHGKNDRLTATLTSMGVDNVIVTNGVLAWELQLGLPAIKSEWGTTT